MSYSFPYKNCANDTLYSLIDDEVIAEVKSILNGGTISPIFVDVIINDELIFNNSGFSMRIKPAALSGNRSLTIPDAGGEIVVAGAVQNITSKLYQARQGTVSAPSYAFDLFSNTGMWNDGANSRLHFSVNGVEVLRLNQNETITYTPIEVQDGSAAIPSYAFSSNRDCGFYYELKSQFVSCAFDGVRKIAIGPNSTIHGNVNFLPFGSAAAPTLAFGSLGVASITGLFYRNPSIIGFTSGGNEIANINTGGLEMATGQILAQYGDVSAPGYSFTGDADTGMFRSAANTLSFSAGNNVRMRITSNAVNIPYSGGGTSLGFDREDNGISAGRLFIDTAALGNNFNISANSGGADIILSTNNGEVIVADGTNIRSQETYDDTTATAANVFISASGLFNRSTSSRKYKKDIEEYKNGLDLLDKFKPITYRNKFKRGQDKDGKKIKIDDDNIRRYAGFLAEDLVNEGLDLFVSFNEITNEPDNVEYSRIVVLLINCIKELNNRFEELEKNKS